MNTGFTTKNECPKCGKPRMRTWRELTDEQKFLAERFPASAKFTLEKRKTHRFCVRCWFEDTADPVII